MNQGESFFSDNADIVYIGAVPNHLQDMIHDKTVVFAHHCIAANLRNGCRKALGLGFDPRFDGTSLGGNVHDDTDTDDQQGKHATHHEHLCEYSPRKRASRC